MKHRFILLALLLLLSACQTAQPNTGFTTLNVFAAASLTDPFTEIARFFESEHPGVKVALVFAGSQQLATQIREGAVVDVYASANQDQMDKVSDGGWVDKSEIRSFASNLLVVILPQENPAGIAELKDLALPGIRIVIAAAEVPVGKYTLEFLELADQAGNRALSYKQQVLQNVVSYENDVKSVLAKVVLGEADAGIVYASDVNAENADRLALIEIPDKWQIHALYPIATLKQSAQPELAHSFVDFVLSEQGQSILQKSGFQQVIP